MTPADRHARALTGWETRRRKGTARPLGPLYITCKRRGCEHIRQVRRPSQQRRGGYCSASCAAKATQNVAKMNPAKGGRMTALRRRQALLVRLDGLTPVEVFKLGYARGLNAKWRALHKKYELVPRLQAIA